MFVLLQRLLHLDGRIWNLDWKLYFLCLSLALTWRWFCWTRAVQPVRLVLRLEQHGLEGSRQILVSLPRIVCCRVNFGMKRNPVFLPWEDCVFDGDDIRQTCLEMREFTRNSPEVNWWSWILLESVVFDYLLAWIWNFWVFQGASLSSLRQLLRRCLRVPLAHQTLNDPLSSHISLLLVQVTHHSRSRVESVTLNLTLSPPLHNGSPLQQRWLILLTHGLLPPRSISAQLRQAFIDNLFMLDSIRNLRCLLVGVALLNSGNWNHCSVHIYNYLMK